MIHDIIHLDPALIKEIGSGVSRCRSPAGGSPSLIRGHPAADGCGPVGKHIQKERQEGSRNTTERSACLYYIRHIHTSYTSQMHPKRTERHGNSVTCTFGIRS